MACLSLRGRRTPPKINPYPTYAARKAYSDAPCPDRGTSKCTWCPYRLPNGGICPDANLLGLWGERK